MNDKLSGVKYMSKEDSDKALRHLFSLFYMLPSDAAQKRDEVSEWYDHAVFGESTELDSEDITYLTLNADKASDLLADLERYPHLKIIFFNGTHSEFEVLIRDSGLSLFEDCRIVKCNDKTIILGKTDLLFINRAASELIPRGTVDISLSVFQILADLNFPTACYNIGYVYEKGLGVEPDINTYGTV